MNMKSFLLALTLATASVLAQTVEIVAPALNQTLKIGHKFTVEVLKPVRPNISSLSYHD